MPKHAVFVLLALVMLPGLVSPLAEAAAATAAFRDCCILNALTGKLPVCTLDQKILHCTPLLSGGPEVKLLP